MKRTTYAFPHNSKFFMRWLHKQTTIENELKRHLPHNDSILEYRQFYSDTARRLMVLKTTLSSISLSKSVVQDGVHGSDNELVVLAREGIEQGMIELCSEGVGGTYFIKDERSHIIGVFKPSDEEPGAQNNPKNVLLSPLLPPGSGYKREIAAYLLDKDNHAGVPETCRLSDVTHSTLCYATGVTFPKSGSIQKFVTNMGNSSSMSPSRFSVNDVHNIGILDLRLFNMDRNDENILVKKEGDHYRLIPIDHTYTLPEKLNNAWFEWLHWPQARKNFSEENMAYIKATDIEGDAAILRSLGIEEKSIRTMKISSLFLKKGAAAGLTLFGIAKKVCRRIPSEESVLEKLVALVDQESKDFEVQFGILLDRYFKGDSLPGVILEDVK